MRVEVQRGADRQDVTLCAWRNKLVTNTQRFEADSLADETVNGEPVSASDSLLTGNLTGNFSNLGLFLRFLLLINEQIQMLASKFPSKWNREFF
jgi:hypothetical protein